MTIDPIYVLSKRDLASFYGDFYARSARAKINDKKLSRDLVPLLPYAEFWGQGDDVLRSEMINDAPPLVRQNLAMAVRQHLKPLESWLTASSPTRPSKEYFAFTNLIMAFHDPRIAGTY